MQLQFIIHFLPVASGFHIYTRAFRSLRVVYALSTVQGTSSTKAKISPSTSRI